MSIQKLRNRFSTGAWIKKISEIYDKVNEIIDNLNGTGAANSGSYKRYVATLVQTSTNAPVATILENTLNSTPVYAYSTDGVYTATLTNAFVANKTAIFISLTGDEHVGVFRNSSSELLIKTFDAAGAAGNDLLNSNTIEIRVYN